MQLNEFLRLLKGVKGSGNQYQAKCPAHEDKNPSLSIAGDNGKILLHCHAGCPQENIVFAMGLNMSDLFTEELKPSPSRASDGSVIVETYDYVDENGNLLYQAVRKEPKGFYQRRPDSAKQGGWLNNLQKVRRVLYNLPSVLAAIKDNQPIYFVEGEKDVNRLNSLGYVATTSGSASSWRDELATFLCDANVIIIPDNDTGGMSYAHKVAKSLVNRVKSLTICEIKSIWADVPIGGDISDLLNLHKGKEVAIIKKLLAIGKPYTGNITQNDAPVVFEQDKGKNKPVFDMSVLQGWLASMGITIRYNMISRKVEIIGEVPRSIPREHGNSLLPIIIHDSLKSGYKQCSRDTIQDLLNVMAVQNRINPIAEMLGSQEWDGVDRLPQVFSIIGIDTNPADGVNISQSLIHKWLLQCLSLALQKGEPAYGADGVLVLTGAQGIGKTTFFRKLAMHPNLFLEGATLDANNKDSKIEATSVWICELGEIESTFRRDVDRLKAFITSASDTYRVPYGRISESTTRRTSFCATANSSEYLVDKTGNRRFWTIAVDNVDFAQLMELDVMQLWLQIWQELRAKGQQCFRLTKTEQATLASRNMKHEKPLPAQEEIEDLFYRAESDAHEDRHYKLARITITQFKTHHEALSKYSSQQIKAALEKMGRMNEKKIKGTRLVELPIVV